MLKVIKRDGKKVNFNNEKIFNAIKKAFQAYEHEVNAKKEQGIELEPIELKEEEITDMVDVIDLKINKINHKIIDIEQIQDIVQMTINDYGYFKVAELYISYRTERTVKRKEKEDAYKTVAKIMKATDRENANVGNGPSGKLLQTAEALGRDFAMSFLTPKGIKEYIEKKIIYRHDESWMIAGTTTCIPDFEHTLIKDINGNTKRIQFDFFNTIMEKYKEKIIINGEQEILDLMETDIRYHIYGRNGWTPLNKIMRRKMKNNENLYKFNIRKGIPLHTTELHQIPVIRNNEEILVQAKEIKIGDELIKIRSSYNEIEELDVLNLFIENKDNLSSDIRITNAKKLIQWLRFYYDDFNFTNEVSNKSMIKGVRELSLEEYEKIQSKYEIPYEVKKLLSISVSGSKKKISSYIPINAELSRLLGYIMSEGSINDGNGTYQISIHNQNLDILEDIKKCIISTFNENPSLRKETGTNKSIAYAICGKVYVEFIKNVLRVKTSVTDINIPDFIFNSSKEIKSNLLMGLFEGDGYYSYKHLGYGTVSENLAKKLVMLLNSMEIDSCYSQRPSKNTESIFNKRTYRRNYDNFIVTVSDVANIRKFISQVDTIKGNDRLKEYAIKSTETQTSRTKSNIVKNIDVISYDRYVFDLETGEHWFTVNDYVVHNCTFIPLRKCIDKGYNTGHGYTRPAKRIKTGSQHACIIFQSNQNDQHKQNCAII